LKIENVEVIGVVGAGTMGHGIAQTCTQAGYAVRLIDVDRNILEKALTLIREGPFGLMKLVEKGKLTTSFVGMSMLLLRQSQRIRS
jgi:3-hydroxybutyryl-CoA dehydrogenase